MTIRSSCRLSTAWLCCHLLSCSALCADVNLVKGGGFDNLMDYKAWQVLRSGEGTVELLPHQSEKDGSFVRLSPKGQSASSYVFVQQSFDPDQETGGSFVVRYRVRVSNDYSGATSCVSVNVLQSRDARSRVTTGTYHGIFRANAPKEAEERRWVQAERPFTVPAYCPHVFVQLLAYGSSGFVDFDDVEVVQVEKGR